MNIIHDLLSIPFEEDGVVVLRPCILDELEILEILRVNPITDPLTDESREKIYEILNIKSTEKDDKLESIHDKLYESVVNNIDAIRIDEKYRFLFPSSSSTDGNEKTQREAFYDSIADIMGNNSIVIQLLTIFRNYDILYSVNLNVARLLTKFNEIEKIDKDDHFLTAYLSAKSKDAMTERDKLIAHTFGKDLKDKQLVLDDLIQKGVANRERHKKRMEEKYGKGKTT